MWIGLILTQAMLTSNLGAEPRPQQTEEQTMIPRLSASSIESPQPAYARSSSSQPDNWLLKPDPPLQNLGKRLLSDQRAIWTSPARLRWSDAEWLIPVAGLTAGAILTDASFSHSLSNNPSTLKIYKDIRTGSVASLGAASGGLYIWSLYSHDAHQRETGLLAGEAIFDS